MPLEYGYSTECRTCSSACFGTFTKSTTVLSVGQPAKQQKVQRNHQRGHSLTEKDSGAWSSNDMENCTRNSRASQRSLCSITASNSNSETPGSNSNINNTSFINHALILWNEQRREWVGNRPQSRPSQPRDPVISWTSTYEDLLGTSRPFSQPVPLPEMVNFLVDVWDQDGLYD